MDNSILDKVVTLVLVMIFSIVQISCSRCVEAGSDDRKHNETKGVKRIRDNNLAVRVGKLTSIWANNGEDKVLQDDLRASYNQAGIVNSVWNGKQVNLFGARNEVVSFNLVMEAASDTAVETQVRFERLEGPNAAVIESKPADKKRLFEWINRPIELFFVRYLQIRGLSIFNYAANYDERHVPRSMQRPWRGAGKPRYGTGWKDRSGADKFYPDIAVPMELIPSFTVQAGKNQSVWIDIYVPKDVPAGIYHGKLAVKQEQNELEIPVRLDVLDFTLPDRPRCKTMVHLVVEDINHRYLGVKWPNDPTPAGERSKLLIDRHFLLAHRHRISLIDSNYGPEVWDQDAPRKSWEPRLDGSLFTASKGYDGPGVGVGNGIFSIGTYGSWGWKEGGEKAMHEHADAWVRWFEAHAPETEYFLYLQDEPSKKDFDQVEQWSRFLASNPGPGKKLRSMSTVSVPVALEKIPSLDIACSGASIGITQQWKRALSELKKKERPLWVYNTMRPACGTITIEDDGVSMRQIAWTQYKLNIDRWFIWAATFYNNNHCAKAAEANVFQHAQTSGCDMRDDPVLGRTGWNYSNGEGLLFYPGTDLVSPKDSYQVEGPLASLRLKHWRRGIQDVEYLEKAARKNPHGVRKLLQKMVPKVLWEVGVDKERDPTYVHTDISWPVDPDEWEKARRVLADWITDQKGKK